MPSAPTSDDARRGNQNLPGMGGVFNGVNMHLYHYAGNNPVRYTDPDGKWFGFDDVFTGPIDELAVLGIIVIYGAIRIYNNDSNKKFSEALSESFCSNIGRAKIMLSNALHYIYSIYSFNDDSSIAKILDGAKPGRETKGHTQQWVKQGSMDDANKDFDSLNPQNIKNIPGGRTGELSEGRKVNVRDHSSDGRRS